MSANGSSDAVSAYVVRCNELMLELRKYLLLLAILAATVTYAAGLNPPGGVWLDTNAGHLTGNQILVVTYHARYNAFSYSNATAFMASAVVILLLVFGFKDEHSHNSANLFVVLRVVMVLDLLALVVAYAAGAGRDMLTTVLASLLVSLIFIYVLLHAVMMGSFLSNGVGVCSSDSTDAVACPSCRDGRGSEKKEREDKRRRKILMLLAIFATTITYTAGLNPPGGFWPDTEEEQDGGDGHRAGDPVLQHRHRRRFVVFFICNTISFVASLLVIMLLLTNRFIKLLLGRFEAKAQDVPYVSMVISLLGLVGAYAAGSCRETDSTAVVVVLYVVGPMLALLVWFSWVRVRHRQRNPEDGPEDKTPKMPLTGKNGQRGLINTAPSLVLLLATLAATVTYQAGLNPPGGFWPDHRDGHKGGDPILLSKHAARYRLFFYFNSTALAASLVVIFMVLRNYLSSRGSVADDGKKPETAVPAVDNEGEKKSHIRAHVVILELVMILDLIGLIGAFAAGCSRDVSTSIYVIALAGGTLVYVVFHIVFFTLHRDDIHHEREGDDMEEKRKLLLLLAILAVTLTYQAGLTPPGGFWLEDGDGEVAGLHTAGDPVLLSNYPRRYTAFFYLNATGFMASVALTILLVNPNLYRAGIKCHALHVCMVAALFGLMGAYAAGTSRHVRTSIYMIGLIILVFTFVVIVTVLLLVFNKKRRSPQKPLPSFIEKWCSKACGHCGQRAATIDNKDKQSPEAGNNSTGTGNNKQEASTEQASDNSTGTGSNKEEASTQEASDNTTGTGNNDNTTGTGNNKQEASTVQAGGGRIGLHTQRRYLMLLGILAASVTYQAGIAPPGGVWPDNKDGHAVGNPILRDSSHHRYHMFFYCNSASFVASVVVITLQLLVDLSSEMPEKTKKAKFLVQTAKCMMVLDLVGLLLAYAAGSTREWETSGYIVLLLVGFCIGIHVIVSFVLKKCSKPASGEEKNHTGPSMCC